MLRTGPELLSESPQLPIQVDQGNSTIKISGIGAHQLLCQVKQWANSCHVSGVLGDQFVAISGQDVSYFELGHNSCHRIHLYQCK
jgi:hypothetical protein